MADATYDALIIGSGASGMFAAEELTAQGLRVLQLEAGPEIGPADFDAANTPRQSDINLWQRAKATLLGQGVQARAAFFDGRMRHLFVNDIKHPYSTPKDAPFVWIRARQAGGRTHTFGRVLLRWTDDDFKVRSRTGKGVDWPIDYAELAPFYDEVERSLGLYGQPDNVPTLPDSLYTHRAELTGPEQQFKAAVEARWPERRVVTWRYIGPEPTRVLRPLRDAIASGRLDIRYNTIARKVLTDASGSRATGVEAIDTQTGKVQVLNARAVVICASPVESIRLLLNSASDRHPDGLGNSSGLLGRYFVDQLPAVAAGSFPAAKGWSTADTAPADPFYRPSGGVYLPRFVGKDGTASTDFAYQGSIGRSRTAPDSPARLSFFGYGVMAPDPDNRITLNPRRKDAWGIPIAHIRCKIGPEDVDTLQRETAALVETITGVGGELEYVGSPLGLTEMGRGAYPDADPLSRLAFRASFRKTMVMGAAIHEAGGARMGPDQADSVLDRHNRSWDVPNLLVTDASAFPGGGVSGTTLTIMAMTVRACRALAEELRSAS
ncbi:MAG TPA: GMC family oxidoreductase [Devosia sp.]|jgi:choline dehydrogenase-like flavoprotein|uniref:GMC family oxidoreductase n=1 Tax=Devosia sp. TaxID=1871048 RepID=UPI002DDCCC4E|nr:GMC family oxidoreductase [Devosia sp.]HEV2517313.1 GMC family oxidoreductase [Devosia sp.]